MSKGLLRDRGCLAHLRAQLACKVLKETVPEPKDELPKNELPKDEPGQDKPGKDEPPRGELQQTGPYL